MKSAIQYIIGKTIDSVVISEENKYGPQEQIFLIFSDGTYYEIYGDLTGTMRVDPGGVDVVLRYVKKFEGELTVYSADSNT